MTKLLIIVDNQHRFTKGNPVLMKIARNIAAVTNKARADGWTIKHFVVTHETRLPEELHEDPAQFPALAMEYGMHQVALPGDVVAVKRYNSGYDPMFGRKARQWLVGFNPDIVASCGFHGRKCAWNTPLDGAATRHGRWHYLYDLVDQPFSADTVTRASIGRCNLFHAAAADVLAI